MALELKSRAFKDSEFIPPQYTCKGMDISPPLEWSKAPAGTKSFALICDDPDAPAGTWVHWVLYDIPADKTSLSEGVVASRELADGSKQGTNDFGKIGYGGPCPPPGRPHRYFFKIYALDANPGLAPGLTKDELLKAVEDYIIEAAGIMGKFKR